MRSTKDIFIVSLICPLLGVATLTVLGYLEIPQGGLTLKQIIVYGGSLVSLWWVSSILFLRSEARKNREWYRS